MAKNLSPGYSQKPLSAKLGLTSVMKAIAVYSPKDYFNWLGTDASRFVILENSNIIVKGPWDFIHLFVNRIDELEDFLNQYRHELNPAGMIWVSWYKKSSMKETEITEDIIRDTCLPLGLVDVKVCAVSDLWSGLKLVIRKELRNNLPS